MAGKRALPGTALVVVMSSTWNCVQLEGPGMRLAAEASCKNVWTRKIQQLLEQRDRERERESSLELVIMIVLVLVMRAPRRRENQAEREREKIALFFH